MATKSKRRGRVGSLVAYAVLVTGPVMVAQAAAPEYLASGGERSMYTAADGTVYGIHTFKDIGVTNFTPTGTKLPLKVEYLVIAGGGGGGLGNYGGGGGAGGYRCSVPGELSGGSSPAESPITLTDRSPVSVVVGDGGTASKVRVGESQPAPFGVKAARRPQQSGVKE